VHIAQNRLGSLTEFRCGARGPSAIGGSDFSGPCITSLRLPAFYEGGTESVRILVPPPARQQRTVPCSGSPAHIDERQRRNRRLVRQREGRGTDGSNLLSSASQSVSAVNCGANVTPALPNAGCDLPRCFADRLQPFEHPSPVRAVGAPTRFGAAGRRRTSAAVRT